MDSADMGRERWAGVSKSERSRITTELARRPRGKDKSIPAPEMPRLTPWNEREAGIISHFDARHLSKA